MLRHVPTTLTLLLTDVPNKANLMEKLSIFSLLPNFLSLVTTTNFSSILYLHVFHLETIVPIMVTNLNQGINPGNCPDPDH